MRPPDGGGEVDLRRRHLHDQRERGRKKSPDGKSRLTDFSSFAGIRKDTNIRDVYLEGRFGGVPRSL